VLGAAPGSEHTCFALVLESEAFAIDADDDRVMEDAIEHRGGEHTIARRRALIPDADAQV